MREFSADYLRYTREGMWADSREALSDLDLPNRERVLDAGCGTGELTRVIAEELDGGAVVGLDADPGLLAHARDLPVVAGDATRLPFRDGVFDLVVCQALLINLPDPGRAVRDFRRVSSDLVAAVEPDNAAVTIESTVGSEPPLEARARRAYLSGVDTDVTLGADAGDLFEAAGLRDVRTHRYDHVRVVEPPYSEDALAAARRKATGAALEDDRATFTAAISDEAFDDLRSEWRAMGRDVVAAMQEGDYRREETVPFYVTVGRVPDGG
ncbi:SAM-dependent methyltransferase [Halobacteriales archaeon QS_8_69_26]|nr:MAG: SAM-dependent methyltransferase [Halobacteriales archaeon QS_8_69_26]